MRPWLRRVAIFCLPTLGLILAWQVWDRREEQRWRDHFMRVAGRTAQASTPAPPDDSGRYYLAADLLTVASPAMYPALGALKESVRDDVSPPPEMAAAASRIVDRNAAALLLVDRARELPFAPLEPFLAWISETQMFVDLDNIVALRMFQQLSVGRLHEAGASAVGRAKLLRIYDVERKFSNALIKARTTDVLVGDVSTMLGRRDLTPDFLGQLAAALGELEDDAQTSAAIRGEAVWIENRVGREIWGDRAALNVRWMSVLRPLWRRAAVAALDVYEQCLDRADKDWPERVTAMQEIRPSDAAGSLLNTYTVVLDPPRVARLCREVLTAQAQALAHLRALRTAFGVEQHRLATGGLPATLEELGGRSSAVLPEDPYTGRPLLYRRRERAYVVYSPGPDGRDDGGVTVSPADRLSRTDASETMLPGAPDRVVPSESGSDIGVSVTIRMP